MLLPDGYSDIPAGKIVAVVTHLEMTARPSLTPSTEGRWHLRHVASPDPGWFRDLYRRIGADWLWFMRLRMSDAELAARIRAPGVEIHALSENGHDEGVLELDFRVPGSCEIGLFGVTVPLIGTGAARYLMERALDLAWSRPVGRVWLHTCSLDSSRALPFYLRSGFTPFRRQIEISDDPRLDGTLPRDAAPHVPVIG